MEQTILLERRRSEVTTMKNGKLRMTLSDDEMTAYAEITPPENGGAPITYKDVLAELDEYGVVMGRLDEWKLKKFISRGRKYPISFIAAKGLAAGKGKDGGITPVWDEKTGTTADRHGNVDLRELDIVKSVSTGQVIAHKSDPVRGGDGYTVTGTVLPGRMGKDRKFLPGKNVIAEKGGLEFRSMINGSPEVKGNVINVNPRYVIEGNVDYSVGNIDFAGSVEIRGDVLDGFKVMAEGDILITGTVEAAKVVAGGNVCVKGGIVTRFSGYVAAGGSISARFISNSIVEADYDVMCGTEIVNSFVRSNGSIRCVYGNGRIVGGDIMARHDVFAANIGSVKETATVVRVGHDYKRYFIISELEQEINKVESVIRDAAKSFETGAGSRNELSRRIRTLVNYRASLIEEVEAHRNAAPENRSAVVRIGEKVFQGVAIYIGSSSRKVNRTMRRVQFSINDESEVTIDICGNAPAGTATEEAADTGKAELRQLHNPGEIGSVSNVVVADCTESSRAELRDILHMSSYEVVGESDSGEDVIRLYERLSPDLMIVALTLQDMNGIAVLSRIKEKYPAARIVITTGVAHRQEIKKAIRMRAAGFITKPFNPAQVLNTLHRAMKSKVEKKNTAIS